MLLFSQILRRANTETKRASGRIESDSLMNDGSMAKDGPPYRRSGIARLSRDLRRNYNLYQMILPAFTMLVLFCKILNYQTHYLLEELGQEEYNKLSLGRQELGIIN